MRTPRPTLYEQNETPGGSLYWEPHVEGIPLPVEGTYYGTIDEALDMYTKYVEMAGFEVKNEAKGKQNQERFNISESDAQMLINKMENKKMYVPNFTFQYKVENSELVAMLWADEVAKCNYKEFGDIESHVITHESHVIPYESHVIPHESHVIPYESHVIPHESHVILMESHEIPLYNMKFAPFIGIDNHGKCVTLGSGMLLHEDTKSY
ncbi:hypothetical protein Tco_0927153, partial [Tanacetum coccineum]